MLSPKISVDWRALLLNHGLPLTLFAILTVLITWPAVKFFTTQLVGVGDARNNLWMLWHVKEALLGRQAWFDLPLLYYPSGVNLLTRGLGPLLGIFALPFWPLGPEATHNGMVLVTMGLSGYFMYLLGRGVGFSRKIAFFAGLFLLMAPIHLAGMLGHMTKTFLGMLPLVLLALYHTLDLSRSRWWAIVTAVLLLLTLLHNAYQFIFAAIAVGILVFYALLTHKRPERWMLLQRTVILGLAILVFVGPLLLAMARATTDPAIPIDNNLESLGRQPDATEFLLPWYRTRLFGADALRIIRANDFRPSIETAVSLSVTGLLLMAVAVVKGPKQARPWLLATLIFVILAAGPRVQWLNETTFTEYELPVILPYAFLTAIPGLDFMRVPGRFMMMGFVVMGIAASYGLAWLTTRYRRLGLAIFLLAIALLLAERWPNTWKLERLRPVPPFYVQLAADPATYGVLDLPVTIYPNVSHVTYSAYYQMYQMTHKKGIASGYLARTYKEHPQFPCLIPEPVEPQHDFLVDGQPSDCLANLLFDLAYFDYRYVVFHKPQPWYGDYVSGSWGESVSLELLKRFFGDRKPLVNDELTTVYDVPPLADAPSLVPAISPQANWYWPQEDSRWARSPATLLVSVPQQTQATLEIVPAAMYAGPDVGFGDSGRLTVSTEIGFSTTVNIQTDQLTVIPLELPAGVYHLTLDLKAGNFWPADFGSDDDRELSFAVRTVNLVTENDLP